MRDDSVTMQDGTIKVTMYPHLSQSVGHAEVGNYDAAAQSLIEHLRQNPDEPQGMAQLGFVAMRMGALGQAEQFLRKAIMLGANSFDVRRNLASVLSQQERPSEAEPLFEALAREGDDPSLRAIRANILERLGRSADALALQEQLAKDNPESPPLWIAYGNGLRAAGRVDEAIAAYRRSIAADAEFGEAWWGLASIKRPVMDDQDIATMRRQLAIAIDIRNLVPLNFALARALHDRGDYATAFHHYDEGNRVRAESLQYNASELTDEISEMERLADRNFIARLGGTPLGESRPVFIVSLPRSGSTLLEQMLGSHPQIEAVGELPYIPAILRSFMERVTRHGRVTVAQALASLPDQEAARLGNDYLQRAALHRKTDKPLFIDKLPHNWSNILFIRRIIPQARFIDIRRPAMDCCFSNFSQSFTSAHAASFALRDVGQCYVDNVRLMDHLGRVAPDLVHHIDYEALVENPRSELGRVLQYLNLDWNDAMLEFHLLDRVVRTPSSEQVRRPLNRDGIAVWKPYSAWLGPLRDVLGNLAEG